MPHHDISNGRSLCSTSVIYSVGIDERSSSFGVNLSHVLQVTTYFGTVPVRETI